jgi:hypothetical protein
MSDQRQGVFVSYSHRDKMWLDRLRMLLKPALGSETIWDDTMIAPGTMWATEIEQAIARVRVAVLLVTPAFLSSDFIMSDELPRIIQRETKEGLTILWVAVEPALYAHSPLFAYQAANDPHHPLSTLPPEKRDVALVDIAEKIIAAVNVNAVAHVLKIIDKVEPELRAFTAGMPAPAQPAVHRVTARQEPGNAVIVVGLDVITGNDMERLDQQSRQLIRAYEAAMNDLFDRFTELEPKRSARDSEVARLANDESERLRGQICEKWQQILKFLTFLGKHLDDHYRHVEFICQQPVRRI